MAGSEDLSDRSDTQDVIDWSVRAMDRLDSLVDDDARRRIMTGCACRYPTAALEAIRGGERTGRPLGAPEFVADLETRTGRALAPRKPGPPPRSREEEGR